LVNVTIETEAQSVDPIMWFETHATEIMWLSAQSTSAASEGYFAEARRTITDERSSLQGARAARLITSRVRAKIDEEIMSKRSVMPFCV
jgi:hypothetical protein